MTRSIQNRGLGMKKMTTVSAFVVVLVLMAFIPGAAQAQMGGQMQMGSQTVQQDQSTGQQPMMPHMMGGQMGRSGMGKIRMMGGGQVDSKTMAKMFQFRGEMLKAMGEIMLEHGKAMEGPK